MTLKTLIIDDEPFVRKDLVHLLAPFDEVEVAGQAGSLTEARAKLAKNRYDLVFLDVRLPGGSGFELLPLINEPSKVVFVTGHDDYAVQAFEINALDYLVKPVSRDRLSITLDRVAPRPSTQEKKIAVKTDGGNRYLSPEEICVITSIGGNYIVLVMDGGQRLVCRKTLKQWEALLPERDFMRIHRSTIVNLGYVSKVVRSRDGSYRVCLRQSREYWAVSRRMQPKVKALFTELETE